MFRRAFALLAVVLASSAGAAAQTARDVLRDFGLLGTWATTCDEPVSSSNFLTVYKGLPNGDVSRTYYNAPNKVYSVFIIKRVSRIGPDQILYEQEGQNDLQFVVLSKIANRYRVFSNHSRAGKQYVQQGKYAKDSSGAHGTDTPWQTRCHD